MMQSKTILDKDGKHIQLTKLNGRWLDAQGNEYVFTLVGVFKL